ncbi:Transglycosylase-like domain-containing protein [Brevibacterium sp. 239c]|uniref:transglycosylase family protein n=1 Tax=Brevibacterium sp. 239c TaxID=1965356 RepID=UPI000C4A1D81|nr:transglycosylase family protein [Brevibacterium sp. 239c]SMY01938.1 Transglycosylase-like domain-containing protein [Brevibacterium sp. 239c]
MNLLSTSFRKVALVAGAGAVAAAGMTGMSGPAQASTGAQSSNGVWDKVAECESGGDWHINTGNGYYGGLQFSKQTWKAFGGDGMPHKASKAEQIDVAQKALKKQGPGAWPECGKKAGLTKSNGAADEGGGSKNDGGSKDDGKVGLGGS